MFGGTAKARTAKRKLIGTMATVMSIGLILTACTSDPAPGKASDDATATVIRVIDGDTIVADIAGTETTVRLLNIDTPETKDPNEPVQCLGLEATAYTKSLLAPGDNITLAYDIERLDSYGRTLAGVYKNENLVNAQIAAAGLGIAVIFEPNKRFYPEIKAAEQTAHGTDKGLFDPKIACTVPATITEALAELEQLEDSNPTSAAGASSALAVVAAAVLAGKTKNAALKALSNGDDKVAAAIWAARRDTDGPKLDSALQRATTLESKLSTSKETLLTSEKIAKDAETAKKAAAERQAVEAKREAEAKKATEAKAKQAKINAEKKAAQQAQAKRQAAAAQAAKAEAQRKAAAKKKAVVPKKTYKAPTKTRTPKKSGGSYSGYTGPRCYAPGGKSWKPCG